MLNLGKLFLYSRKPIASGDLIFSTLSEVFGEMLIDYHDNISLSVKGLHDISYSSDLGKEIVERFREKILQTYAAEDYVECKNYLVSAENEAISSLSNPSVYDIFATAYKYFEESVGDINSMGYPILAVGPDFYNSRYNPHSELLFDDRKYVEYIKSKKVLGSTEAKIQHDIMSHALEFLFEDYSNDKIIATLNSDINSDTCTKNLRELSFCVAEYIYDFMCEDYGLATPNMSQDGFASYIYQRFTNIVDGANEMRNNPNGRYPEYEYCYTFADVVSYFDGVAVEDFVK